jgi:hypothetical protein
MRVVVFVLALLIAVQTAQADSAAEIKSGDFALQVDVRAQANLIYHLDCMRRVSSCTSEVFEQLWREQIGLTDDDKKFLDDWAALRKAIEQADSGNSTLKLKSSLPIMGPRDDLTWSKVRYVDFASGTADDLQRGWSAFMPKTTSARLIEIVEHFRPRFETWWREHEAEATAFIPGAEAALRKAQAPELLRAAAKLYRSDLGDRRLYVHLFLQPKIRGRNSRAGLVGPHLVIEIQPGEDANDRVDVVVHELAHHLFVRMSAERKVRLSEAILASGAAGPPAWHLFDEVQATVIGNIMAGRNAMSPERFKRRLDTPRGFYADEAIDLGARASEQLFAEALKKGRAMPPSFAKDYVAAMQMGMGEKLVTPSLYLRSVMINIDDEASPYLNKFRGAVRSHSSWSMSPLGEESFVERLDRYPGASVVVIALADQMERLAPAARGLGVGVDGLRGALADSRGVIVVSQRRPLAYSFIFLARDGDAMDGLISAFAACRLKVGVCMRID